MGNGSTRKQKVLIGLAGITRAASGGMLGTALAVYVGRDGSPLAVGLLATAFFLSSIVFAPMWGTIADLTGKRRSLLLGLSVMTTLSVLSFILIKGVWGLISLRALYAVFAVGFGPLMLAIVGNISGRERRGRSTGLFSSALAFGDMGGQILVGILLGLLLPSEMYIVIGSLSVIATVVIALIDDPTPASDTDLKFSEVLRGMRHRLLPDARERELLRQSGLTWLYVGLVLRHLTVKGVGSLVPIYLVARIGVSELTMGLLLTISPAAQIVFMVWFGRMVDIGSRKNLILLGITISGLHAIVLGAATLPSAHTAKLLVAGVSFVFIAAGFSAMDLGCIAFIGDTVPSHRESAFIGLRSTAAGIGGVIGPALVGITAVVTSYEISFVLSSVFAFIATGIVLTKLYEPERTQAPSVEKLSVETSTEVGRQPGIYRGNNAK